MITAASQFIKTWLSRDIAAADYVLTLNGQGTSRIFTPQYPIINVSFVSINGTSVAAATAPPLGNGFLFDKEAIAVNGNFFPVGFQNISISYSAGFQAVDATTVPSDNTYKLAVSTLTRPWVVDRGVALANGTALTKVTTSPAADEYSVVDSDGVMVYQFNAANVGASINITYGYCPEDLEQALIDMIGERYSTRERIGQTSKQFGGEVVAFSTKDFNSNVADVFNQYKNVVPV